MRLAWMLSLALIGCAGAKDRCGNTFLLPWPNAEGRYVLQEIQLNTLNDPYKLEGGAARIFAENVLTNGGFSGPVAEPHYVRAGDVCVPADTTSSMAVSAYAQMEKLYDFERRIGTVDQISWPRAVGVDVHLKGEPSDVVNNAHYYGDPDSMALVPYDRPNLPVSFNLGIVAHEHFHAHFQATVYRAFNSALSAVVSIEKLFLPDSMRFAQTADNVKASDPNTPRGYNNYVLRGWNEGLADFFAGIYTGRPDFFTPSLPDHAYLRKLDGVNFRMHTYPLVITDPYAQGTVVARVLYAIAHKADVPPERVLALVMGRLGDLPRVLLKDYGQKPFPVDDFMKIVLRDVPLNKAVCGILKTALNAEVFSKEFAKCGP